MWHGQYLVRLFGCAEWNGVHRDCFLSKDQRKRLYKILKFAFLCSLIYLLFFLLPVLLALYLRSHCWVQCHKALPLCFLPRVFIVLGLSFRSLGHLSYFLCISKCVGFFIYYFWLRWVFYLLFLAALGLCCFFFFFAQAFSSSGEQGLPFAAVRGLFIAVTSLAVECRL